MGTMQMSPLIVVFIIFSSKDHITYCDFCGWYLYMQVSDRSHMILQLRLMPKWFR
jgi:hypothetical protein